jgi:hypothetical protein
VSLLTELDAFFTEHWRCGELDVGIEDDRIVDDVPCVAVLVRVAAFG